MRNAPRPALPLIVGEAPSKTGDRFWLFPLSGDPAVKMCRWAGWHREPGVAAYWALREHADTTNLLERYPGPLGRGADLPRRLAEPAWEALQPELAGRVVVLLGVRLGRLAGLTERHEWVVRGEGDARYVVAMVPHTSGLSHTYNDVAERERTGQTLRDAEALAAWAATQ